MKIKISLDVPNDLFVKMYNLKKDGTEYKDQIIDALEVYFLDFNYEQQQMEDILYCEKEDSPILFNLDLVNRKIIEDFDGFCKQVEELIKNNKF
jgi:hypothetical protein